MLKYARAYMRIAIGRYAPGIFKNYFIKAIEHALFPCLQSRTKVMQTLDYFSGLHNFLELSQPSSCLDEAM